MIAVEMMPYEVNFPDNLPEDVKEAFEKHSQLIKLKDKDVRSPRTLSLRAKHDLHIFQKILKSLGYFESYIKISLKYYPTILVKIQLGKRFCLGKIFLSHPCPTYIQSKDLFDAKSILAEVDHIKQILQEQGYAFVEVRSPEFSLHKQCVDLRYQINLGPCAQFGDTKIVGLSRLSASFVKNRLLWKPNDLYHPEKIKKTRRRLLATGLFSKVDGKFTKDRKIILKVKEAALRSLGASFRYAHSLGVEAGLSFKHYNVKGHGESFQTNVRLAKYIKSGIVSYEIPDFILPFYKLRHEISAIKDNTRAYKNKEGSFKTSLTIPHRIKWCPSLKLERALSSNALYTYNTLLLIPKIDAEYGRELDGEAPEKGFVIGGGVIPHIGFIHRNIHATEPHDFYKITGRAMAYVPIKKHFKWCNFVRGAILPKARLETIPPKKRLYSGGFDSIRAYRMQMLGPIDHAGNPTGWDKMLEYGTELRWRCSENIDFVTFAEGGWLTKNLWGGGLGVRYIADFGVLRADIAFPAKRRTIFNGPDNPRKFVDSKMQILVGVGQTF